MSRDKVYVVNSIVLGGQMTSRLHPIFVICGVFACILIAVELSCGQGRHAFNSAAVEAATNISNGMCLNPVIGISYQLPEDLKPEDGVALHHLAYRVDARMYGVGPEARWFLWGYGERTETAWLCGANGNGSQIGVIAMPAHLVQSEGPGALKQLAQGVGQQLGVQPSPVRHVAVNGLNLECADVHATVNSPSQGGLAQTFLGLRSKGGTVFLNPLGTVFVPWTL